MGRLAKAKELLTAIHNTTAEGVKAARRLGGIPAPSHAVVPKGRAIEGFGDISLVAPRALIDPARGHKLFEADVYSRRQPRPSFRLNSKARNDALNEVQRAMNEFQDSSRWEIDDWVKNGDPGQIRNSDGLMVAYGRAHGVDFPAPRNLLDSRQRAEIESKIRELGREQRSILESVDVSDMELDEIDSLMRPAGDQIKALKAKLTAGSPPSTIEIREKLESAGLDPYGGEKWLSDSMVESGQWHSPYFMRGKKKVDYTLENLSDYMTARTRATEQTMTEGLGKQRSRHAKQFKSVDAARAQTDRIVSHDEMRAFQDATNEDLFALASRVSSPYDSQWQKLDDLSAAVGDVMGGVSPQSALARRDLSGDVDDELIALAQKVRGGPTEYFESKAAGPVRLEDYLGAAVPKKTPDDVVAMLENAGLRVEKYAEGDRAKAISRIPGSSFAVAPMAAVSHDSILGKASDIIDALDRNLSEGIQPIIPGLEIRDPVASFVFELGRQFVPRPTPEGTGKLLRELEAPPRQPQRDAFRRNPQQFPSGKSRRLMNVINTLGDF